MKQAQTMLITTIVLSFTLASIFTIDFTETSKIQTQDIGFPLAEAVSSGDKHDIQMEAVKMPDGMYAYRMVDYELTVTSSNNNDDEEKEKSETRNLVQEGI
ncbi:MAG: hypothetical protein ACPGQP_03980, partial [Nitrosopumilus sp.]